MLLTLALLCTAALAQPAAPLLTLNLSAPLDTVDPQLFGLNLEFTRHDLFAGLSAQLLANRLFTLQPPGTAWPSPINNWGSLWPPRWEAIGPMQVCPPAPPAVTSQCMRCSLGPGDGPCGLRQGTVLGGFGGGYGAFGSAIGLQAQGAYCLVVYVTASAPLSLLVNVSGLVTQAVAVAGSGALERLEVNFTFPGPTATGATLELSFEGATAPATSATLVATSLLPADHFHGMRRDVVGALKALNFSGPLRYPGGCAAPFYRWRDGLLPRELRPVVQTPPNYCTAVQGGVNAYTDGFMENGPSTDEYLALCRELGALPVITLALQYGTAEEVEAARAWAEYTNGPASSPMGALRAARGQPAPYNVSLWYLGNEIAWQARYPDYPSQPSNSSRGASGAEYAGMVQRLTAALLGVDPGLRFSAVDGGSAAFDAPWAQGAAAAGIGLTSYHGGYAQGPLATPADYTRCATAEGSGFLPGLASLRGLLDSVGAGGVRISADEWGFGPPWTVARFSTAHAVSWAWVGVDCAPYTLPPLSCMGTHNTQPPLYLPLSPPPDVWRLPAVPHHSQRG